MAVKAVLIFNSKGKPRLIQWYQQMDVATQQKMLTEIFGLVSKRSSRQCNFLDGSDLLGTDIRIIYRNFATLYFVFVVDSSESELGILDLIQVFVESLDRMFTNVCELDLIFKPEEVANLLGEIISGGMVLETSIAEISVANEMHRNDPAQRQHSFKVHLPPNYPKQAPRFAYEMPLRLSVVWSASNIDSNGIKAVFTEFRRQVDAYQRIWDQLDSVDKSCHVLEPSLPIEQGCRDKIFRRIALTRESTLLMEFEPLEVNYKSSTPHLDHPLNQLPKIKLFGDEKVVSRLQKCLNQNIAQWNPSHSLKQNLETVLSLTLPSKPSAKLSDHLLDTAHTCGMCFSYSLNDCVPEVLCLNEVCGRTFHTACALEWLQSLPTTRRTFDMIVGDCPYCKHSISFTVLN